MKSLETNSTVTGVVRLGTLILAWLAVAAVVRGAEVPPPAVTVTLRADAASIGSGTSTVVHAFARVSPTFEARADRVFTWNLDLLVLTPEVLELEPGSLVRPVSDHDPVLGSSGVVDGPNLLAVRDSFLDLDHAGVGAAVELFAVRVRALAPGAGQLRLRHGTLGTEGSPDFLVLPAGDDDPWSGGDYTAAFLDILVPDPGSPGGAEPRLAVERDPTKGVVRVTVQGQPGDVVALEESPALGDSAAWRRVGQSSAGTASFVHETTPDTPGRFFRGVRLPSQ